MSVPHARPVGAPSGSAGTRLWIDGRPQITPRRPRMVPAQSAAALREVDDTIIALVRKRCELVTRLPEAPATAGSHRTVPLHGTVRHYRAALGAPGELLARALLILCRTARHSHNR